jgi:topoisomerase-4 subunit A
VHDAATDFVIAISSSGNLLAFPASELPELDKGKGNKILQIPPAKLKAGEENIIAVTCVKQGGELTLLCGQRKLVLSWRDLQAYQGTRAQRGHALPRGFQRVDSIESN